MSYSVVYKLSYNLEKVDDQKYIEIFYFLKDCSCRKGVDFTYCSKTQNLEFNITDENKLRDVIHYFVSKPKLMYGNLNFNVLIPSNT